jgi:hypothetical protein
MIIYLDETFGDVLVGYEESDINNAQYQSFLKNMHSIAKELNQHGIDSVDFVNPANIGYKNGNLATFDLGFGDGFNQPPKLPIIDASEGKYLDVIKNKLNLSKFVKVGEGTFGVAYDIGDDAILKITKDNSEVYNSLRIKGKEMKYVADIYEVYELFLGKDSRKYWIIILEKLKTNDKIKSNYELFKKAYDKAKKRKKSK